MDQLQSNLTTRSQTHQQHLCWSVIEFHSSTSSPCQRCWQPGTWCWADWQPSSLVDHEQTPDVSTDSAYGDMSCRRLSTWNSWRYSPVVPSHHQTLDHQFQVHENLQHEFLWPDVTSDTHDPDTRQWNLHEDRNGWKVLTKRSLIRIFKIFHWNQNGMFRNWLLWSLLSSRVKTVPILTTDSQRL